MENKWDRRFLNMALNEVTQWSRDPSTKVAAVIVDPSNHIRAVSYNGFPKGIADTDERLNNRAIKYQLVQHAEANGISTCSKLGISTDGCTMAVTHLPCSTCAGLMINAGIKKVITRTPSPEFAARWADAQKLTVDMFKEAGVQLIILDELEEK